MLSKKKSRSKNSLWSKGLKFIAILALISLTIANKAGIGEILYCAPSLLCLHSLSIGDFQVKKKFKLYLCLIGPRCTKKPDFVACIQQRLRPTGASAQSD